MREGTGAPDADHGGHAWSTHTRVPAHPTGRCRSRSKHGPRLPRCGARPATCRRTSRGTPGDRRGGLPGGTAGRPTRRRRSAPTGPGGTPRPPTTTPSTAPSSATPTSSGDRRACGRPRRTCSATSTGMTGARDRRGRGPVRALGGRPGRRPVVATDLSAGMLERGPSDQRHGGRPTAAASRWCSATAPRSPSPTRPSTVVFTAYGVVPFVADSGRGAWREAARVLRPGGRFVFSTTHPVRWAMPDDPGEQGLTRDASRTSTAPPYVEQDAAGPGDLRRAPPDPRRPGARDRRRRAWCSSTSSSRSGRSPTSRPGAAGRRCAAGSSPGRRSS